MIFGTQFNNEIAQSPDKETLVIKIDQTGIINLSFITDTTDKYISVLQGSYQSFLKRNGKYKKHYEVMLLQQVANALNNYINENKHLLKHEEITCCDNCFSPLDYCECKNDLPKQKQEKDFNIIHA